LDTASGLSFKYYCLFLDSFLWDSLPNC